MLLSSLLLSDLLFLSKYIRLPRIINVPLICSGNVWRIFDTTFALSHSLFCLTTYYPSHTHEEVLNSQRDIIDDI